MTALVVIALAATGYALREAAHGNWMPFGFAAVAFSVYGLAFWIEHRQQRRSSDLFHAKFVKPTDLRIERHSRRRSF